jgi:hypothetical protein
MKMDNVFAQQDHSIMETQIVMLVIIDVKNVLTTQPNVLFVPPTEMD